MAIEQTAEAIAPSTTKIEMINMLVYVKVKIRQVATSQCLVIARVNTLSAGKDQGYLCFIKSHSRIPRVNSRAKNGVGSILGNKNAGYSSHRKLAIPRSCSRSRPPELNGAYPCISGGQSHCLHLMVLTRGSWRRRDASNIVQGLSCPRGSTTGTLRVPVIPPITNTA